MWNAVLGQASERAVSAAGQTAANSNSGSIWWFIGFLVVCGLLGAIFDSVNEANRPKRYRVHGEAEEIR